MSEKKWQRSKVRNKIVFLKNFLGVSSHYKDFGFYLEEVTGDPRAEEEKDMPYLAKDLSGCFVENKLKASLKAGSLIERVL